MLAKVKSQAVIGIQAHYVDVEVHIGGGQPKFSIVGLPDTVVKESRDRVKSAIKTSGFEFPARNIVVNLAPANIKKIGTSFDLPIALGLLVASGCLKQGDLEGKSFCGELSLDGELRPVVGTLPMAAALSENGIKQLVLPIENASEASNLKGIEIFAVRNLREAYLFLKRKIEILPSKAKLESGWNNSLVENMDIDFADVIGQASVKRGLEIAASGSHNVLLLGPPGTGKTMLARRLVTILPKMTFEEALETTKIYSVVGLLKSDRSLVTARPFRAPHHSISYAALIGGGPYAKAGEISLAHNGVLFLDELPQFRRDIVDMLRQPMEDGSVTISRVNSSCTYPARYMLIAAMNPCPCGNFTDTNRECICSPQQIQKYISKISGPFLDRIDIHLQVPSLKYKDLMRKERAETSLQIKQRVDAAMSWQKRRYNETTILCNAHLLPGQIEKFCTPDKEAEALLKDAIANIGLSARAYHRILKVARTIADLADSEKIKAEHISEAIGYRTLDITYK